VWLRRHATTPTSIAGEGIPGPLCSRWNLEPGRRPTGTPEGCPVGDQGGAGRSSALALRIQVPQNVIEGAAMAATVCHEVRWRWGAGGPGLVWTWSSAGLRAEEP